MDNGTNGSTATETSVSTIRKQKNIALVAHDHMKDDLIEWVEFNSELLSEHNLISTGTTGGMIERIVGLPVTKLESGPLGGDLQLGARCSEGKIDMIVFFWDPLQAQPHDPDVKALIRIAVVWNIPTACNRATADFLVASKLMGETYQRNIPDYTAYKQRGLGSNAERADEPSPGTDSPVV